MAGAIDEVKDAKDIVDEMVIGAAGIIGDNARRLVGNGGASARL